MFVVTYLASVVSIAALGLWIHSLVEQRVSDMQTIHRLRQTTRDLTQRVEELENEVAMLKVF